MPIFAVTLKGENFEFSMDKHPQCFGFMVTKSVRATDQARAEYLSIKLVWQEAGGRASFRDQVRDPTITVESIVLRPWWHIYRKQEKVVFQRKSTGTVDAAAPHDLLTAAASGYSRKAPSYRRSIFQEVLLRRRVKPAPKKVIDQSLGLRELWEKQKETSTISTFFASLFGVLIGFFWIYMAEHDIVHRSARRIAILHSTVIAVYWLIAVFCFVLAVCGFVIVIQKCFRRLLRPGD